MRFHVACPHCGEEQFLKFGDKETPYGLKWSPGEPDSVFYLCEHHGCVIRQRELDFTHARYVCERTGIWTRDGLDWYSSGNEEISPPESTTFHIWTAYSPFTTWVQIVKEWIKTKGDIGKQKTFVNTTLGETWEEAAGEQLDHEVLLARREAYTSLVPPGAVYLTGGIDSQTSGRYECYVWGWGAGEEAWLVDKVIVLGRYDDVETLARVDDVIRRQYRRADGTLMGVSRWAWDTGGIDPDIVYRRSLKLGLLWVIPVKGASKYGGPVADMPRTRNKQRVYLTMVGTDTAKDLIHQRLQLEAGPGSVHFPLDDDLFGETEAKQITAEVLVPKPLNGRVVYRWDNQGRRNETLDCFVYALAALRISISRFQVNLERLSEQQSQPKNSAAMSITDMARQLGSP